MAMRNITLFRSSIVAFVGLFVAMQASAQTYQLDANLDPFQEVPPQNTPGYGWGNFMLDASTGIVTVDAGSGQYADLLAGATTVRIQDAAVGANGPTLIVLN